MVGGYLIARSSRAMTADWVCQTGDALMAHDGILDTVRTTPVNGGLFATKAPQMRLPGRQGP